MKMDQSRRSFIKKGTTFCVACGALTACPGLKAMNTFLKDDEIPNPKILEYCGYTCPPDCPLFKATQENDPVAKKECYEKWEIKERYGLDYDEETMFCYSCKAEDKPLGVTVQNCPIRNCTIEKGFDCCIECDELKDCKKGAFERFPEFHEGVVKMQEKYRAAQA